jgi:hypothetical protein
VSVSCCRERRAGQHSQRMHMPRHQPRPRSRPVGAVQTLGGRRSGGMRNSAETCDKAGRTCEASTRPGGLASAIGDDNVWRQFTRQLLPPGQNFWGQLGHGLAGLWQGITCTTAVAWPADAIASACVDDNGTAATAPSMAIMPRTKKHRWYRRCLTSLDCHNNVKPAISPRSACNSGES